MGYMRRGRVEGWYMEGENGKSRCARITPHASGPSRGERGCIQLWLEMYCEAHFLAVPPPPSAFKAKAFCISPDKKKERKKRRLTNNRASRPVSKRGRRLTACFSRIFCASSSRRLVSEAADSLCLLFCNSASFFAALARSCSR